MEQGIHVGGTLESVWGRYSNVPSTNEVVSILNYYGGRKGIRTVWTKERPSYGGPLKKTPRKREEPTKELAYRVLLDLIGSRSI